MQIAAVLKLQGPVALATIYSVVAGTVYWLRNRSSTAKIQEGTVEAVEQRCTNLLGHYKKRADASLAAVRDMPSISSRSWRDDPFFKGLAKSHIILMEEPPEMEQHIYARGADQPWFKRFYDRHSPGIQYAALSGARCAFETFSAASVRASESESDYVVCVCL